MPQLSSLGPVGKGNTPEDPVAGKIPSSAEVEKFHTHADTDGDEGSLHHTLGPGRSQASAGDHTHDGGSSKVLGVGFTITGAKGGNAALASVIAFLVDKFGVTDSTT